MIRAMSQDRQHTLRDLLEEALNHEPLNREEFIRSASHDDAMSDAAWRILQRAYLSIRERHGVAGLSDKDRIRNVLREMLAVSTSHGADNSEGFRGTTRFELRRQLGSGGFGVVYEAYDRHHKRLVALKVLRSSIPAFVYRFKREFRALVDIRHPNLIELYELIQDGSFWFFSMELIHGIDVLRYVEPGQPLRRGLGPACDLGRLRTVALQLADGLLALHGAGILHRDIKPGNVIVSRDGHVRILDFGLVREAELSNPHSVMFAGTPDYMAPEQAAQLPVGPPSDWYSFGVVLFQALVGSFPNQLGSDYGISRCVQRSVFPPEVPDDLATLCCDLLRPDPTTRPSGPEIFRRLGGRSRSPLTIRSIAPPEIDDNSVIGRDSYLLRLHDLLELTKQGRPVIVNLHGKSGIGKSTLLKAFQRRIARDDSAVICLTGRCHESETVPYKALDDLIDHLSHYLKALSDADAEALTPRDVHCLVRVFPVLGQAGIVTRVRYKATEISDAQELRQRAFASLQDLLSRLADRRIVVLVIDDLQWGDLDSAAFLNQMLRAASPPSLLLIACYRTEDAATSPFLQSWSAFLATMEVDQYALELEKLAPHESTTLISYLLAGIVDVDERYADAIARESGGSPFLIEQIAQYFKLGQAKQTPVIRMSHVIESRLATLPGEALALLQTIAIAGQPLACSVANTAADLDASDQGHLAILVNARLVRMRETGGPREVEVYHDQIRQAIAGAIPPQTRQLRHLKLAQTLESDSATDPAVLASHFQLAGEKQIAIRHTLAAAEYAVRALAFERAIRFYETALDGDITWGPEETVTLQRKLADTLVYAGHGARAAHVYLSASSICRNSEALRLKLLAAEQWLRSGHFNEGIDLLRAVARNLDIWLPTKSWQTLLSLLIHRLRIALSGLRFRERRPEEIPASQLIALDVYWSLAIGLTFLDTIQALDFQSRHLLLARRTGDRDRFSMALSVAAGHYATSRRRSTQKLDELLRRAEEFSIDSHHPEAPGLVAVMRAGSAALTGTFRDAWNLSTRADQILRERCTGVAWDRATNIQIAFSSAYHLGEWSRILDYPADVLTLVRDANTNGDLHAMCALLPGVGAISLATDRPHILEGVVDDISSKLPAGRFILPTFFLLEAQVVAALYKAQTVRALQLVELTWPELSASQLLRLQYVRIMAFHLRARAIIASAAASHDDVRHAQRLAHRYVQTIERERTLWGDALALAARAGSASLDGDQRVTCDLLARAETAARAADMSHVVAACQQYQGSLLGGTKGRQLVGAAAGWAKSERVQKPSGVFQTFVPGRF
jgi:serine/threonine protein kinase